jgi:hypothetical protein
MGPIVVHGLGKLEPQMSPPAGDVRKGGALMLAMLQEQLLSDAEEPNQRYGFDPLRSQIQLVFFFLAPRAWPGVQRELEKGRKDIIKKDSKT